MHPTSPAIESASATYAPSTDLLGNHRPSGLKDDLGCYEFQNTVVWTGATSSAWNVGSNWSNGAVPNANSYVIIPDQSNDPVISSANDVAGVLKIHAGANLYLYNNSK